MSLSIDGVVVQSGSTSHMITPILDLICEASQTFTLLPGDVIMTGTPAGVGPLAPGQVLEGNLGDVVQCIATVVEAV